MRCILLLLAAVFWSPRACAGFKTRAGGALKFTALENIVRSGVQRLVDNKADSVLRKCRRPLVIASDRRSEFDLHTKVAGTVARELGMDAEHIKKELSRIATCKTIHDRVNIRLTDQFILEQLERMAADDRLGVQRLVAERVLVDYFSPNVGKKLHMGHVRSLAIGQSLANMLEFAGCKVLRRNHVGDFGAHTGILMRYIMEYDTQTMDCLDPAECDRERLLEWLRKRRHCSLHFGEVWDLVGRFDRSLPEFANKLVISTMDAFYKLGCEKFKSDPEFARRARVETKLLQNAKSLAQLQWNTIRDVSLGHYRDLLELYFVEGLKHMPESLYRNVAVRLINELVSQGKAAQDGELVVVDLAALPATPEAPAAPQGAAAGSDSETKAVLRTPDGCLTYMAVDLAALAHRASWSKPNRVIYVTDKNQKSHFEKVGAPHVQLRTIAKKLDVAGKTAVEHVGFGQVRVEGGGRMRSRAGESPGLAEVTKAVIKTIEDELVARGECGMAAAPTIAQKLGRCAHAAGAGTILFNDLSSRPADDYTFSIERVLNQGRNRLVAVMYAYARTQSILAKAEGLERVPAGGADAPPAGFRNEAERRLALALVEFETVVVAAVAGRAPDRLCKYLVRLAREFNAFYNESRVIEGGAANATPLRLVELAGRALETGLKLLNIKPVRRI